MSETLTRVIAEQPKELWQTTDDRDSWELIKRVEAKLKTKNE